MPQTPVLELLAKLIRIPSVNPSYAGGVSESACAGFIEDTLRALGIQTWRQAVWPDRSNVLALIPGNDRTRRIVFEAHIDTVSIQGMTIPPFEPSIVDGKMLGRGACDTKGGLAAMMQAMMSIQQQGLVPEHDLLLAAVVDEEFSYRGVAALCQGMEPRSPEYAFVNQFPHGQASAPQAVKTQKCSPAHSLSHPLEAALAVVAEPTDLRMVVASKGVLRWRVETIGLAAHSSRPHLGRNAIVAMARVIQLLEQDSQNLNKFQHPLLGCPTINIGTIQGGVQVNFVPERCVIEVDRRLLPDETWEAVFRHYDRLLDQVRQLDPEVSVVMHPPMLTDLALECPTGLPVIQQVSRLLESMQLDGRPIGVPYGSDASKLAAIGIPSIIFGPGSIDQAHSAVEYVDCCQVERAVDVYRGIMQLKIE